MNNFVLCTVCHFEKNHGAVSLILSWQNQFKIKEKRKIISEINRIEFVLFCTTKQFYIMCHFQENTGAANLIFKLAEP